MPVAIPVAGRRLGALLSPLLLPLLGGAAGCVAYAPAVPTVAEVALSPAPEPPQPLDFPAAVAHAFAHQPELQALAAEARAAGADLAAVQGQGEYRSREETLAVMVDPLALLGLAQREAEIGLVSARAAEAVAALANARWRTAAAIAEAFAVARALDAAPPAPAGFAAPEPFAAAGLAAPAAVAGLRAAAAAAQAEAAARAAERQANDRELRRLLGLPDGPALRLQPPVAPPRPPQDPAALQLRPDLRLQQAAVRVADAAFRQAVGDQYPAVMFGPEVSLMGRPVEAMAWLRLPTFATGPARAARERRDAARLRLFAAWQAAVAEAAAARAGHAAAADRAAATAAAAAASAQALAVARVGLDTEVEGFDRYAEVAPMAVRDAMEARDAAVAAARAQVRCALAAGWPLAGEAP